MVYLVWVIVPLAPMVMFPETVSAFATDKLDTFVPAPTVRDLQVELALRAGWLAPVKFASPMMASVPEVGTPAVQLAALFQSVLVAPAQEVTCATASSG